jgi:hypothetical protein
MARSSIALFLVTTGLITATMGCGKSPEPKGHEGVENGVGAPAPDKPAAAAPDGDHNNGDKKDADKKDGGEGGEGGEG